MQLKRLMAVGVTVLVAAACGDSTGVTVQDLEGTWIATLYQSAPP